MKSERILTGLLIAAMLAGCAAEGKRAPVISRGAGKPVADKATREKDWRPRVHVVQKGDTLYSIALNYGFDYHELAELNGIQDPGVIKIGQEIRLFAAAKTDIAKTEPAKPAEPPIKEGPRVVKYVYSEEALAKINGSEKAAPAPKPVAKVEPKPEATPQAAQPQDAKSVDARPQDGGDEVQPDADMEWSIPTEGKVIAEYSETANRKGIDIIGKLGQPVNASAPGKVVYSGSGLRGYGKLVIIKHNNTFLSAYAHNDKLLVKEGQTVERGQKIAEMGNTDADRVKLHFEVRRFGKPVDPAKYLNLGKS